MAMKPKHNLEAARAALPAKTYMRRPPKTVSEPVEEPATTNPQPQRAAIRRKALVEPSAIHGKQLGKDLKVSLHFQERLRRLTHRVLMAQEDERGKLSHELRDEIAQILLGINVRLLLLKQAARSQAKGLNKEIASAQRLVVRSTVRVRRLAHELEIHRAKPSELTVATI